MNKTLITAIIGALFASGTAFASVSGSPSHTPVPGHTIQEQTERWKSLSEEQRQQIQKNHHQHKNKQIP